MVQHSRQTLQLSVPPEAKEAKRPQVAAPAQLPERGHSHFDIYRTEQVRLTSTLFGGGDWHWRLTGSAGEILADCGGYRNHRDCLAVVDALRDAASSAFVSGATALSPS